MNEDTKENSVSEKRHNRRPPAAGKGRPKGATNKTTRAVKEALIEAFENMGGIVSLVEWAKKDPGEFYKLWVKVMPTQLEHSGSIELGLTEEMSDWLDQRS